MSYRLNIRQRRFVIIAESVLFTAILIFIGYLINEAIKFSSDDKAGLGFVMVCLGAFVFTLGEIVIAIDLVQNVIEYLE